MATVTTTKREQQNGQLVNPGPIHSSSITDTGNEQYKYAQYLPIFPDVSWAPLKEVKVVDRGVSADPTKKTLLSAASKVITLTPTIGTELHGIDLRQLSDAQRTSFFRNQDINIHEQLGLARYWGPLHTNATTAVPKEPGLDDVHVVYNLRSLRSDPGTYSSVDRWHSDASYELQPPSTTSLKMIACPETGSDTLWSSGYALYSSLSPGLQTYLEGLSAVHTATTQTSGARAAGTPVRRESIETVQPVVRVHPATGWKSVFVSPGSTRHIVGIPKAESDTILGFLYAQICQNHDFQVRFKWELNDVAIWDNRVVTHSATFDFEPSASAATRHALRATPHGERPISVADYECTTGKRARDRQLELLERQGIVPQEQEQKKPEPTKSRGIQ